MFIPPSAGQAGISTVHAFKKYQRVQVAELRPYIPGETPIESVSVSDADRRQGSPKLGDMIARNPKNHADQWLVAADYFADNFVPADAGISQPDDTEDET
jgi:hypothetical protein